MVYHPKRRQPNGARLVVGLPHDTDKSAIHNVILQ